MTGTPDASTLLGLAAVITASATLLQTIRATPPRPARAKRAKRPPAAEGVDHAPDPPAAARLAIAWRFLLTIVFAGASAATGPPAGALVPIAAHHALLSGSTSCAAGAQLVTWEIGNEQPRKPMTIVSATATLNDASWPVDGYTNPVAPSGTTEAHTTLSGTLSGPLALDVAGSWPDGHHWSGSASVALLGDCESTTTTSPVSTSTTSPTPTSPTTASTPSSVLPRSTDVVTTMAPSSPTTSPAPNLAATGGPVADAVVVGLSVTALGSCVLLILRNRRRPYAVARRRRRRTH